MKKLYFLLALCFMIATAGVAVAAESDTIKMVTYFPVPYMAYNDLNVFGRCDVGGYEGCNMTIGGIVKINPDLSKFSGSNRDTDFKTGVMNVLGGTLDLRAASSSSSPFLYTRHIWLGSTETTTAASFVFKHNVEITKFYPREMNLTAATRANIKTLYLNGKLFPQCTAPKMHWKQLEIDRRRVVVLECGS